MTQPLTHPDYARIGRAIAYLEQHYQDQPSLDDVAAHVGLSPAHFQRQFSHWAGISPKRFAGYLTLDHAKQLLEDSSSIMDAAWDAGLSTPSRLHDLFVTYEAMTPGKYKQKGYGLSLTYGFAHSALGEVIVVWSDRGITGLGFTLEFGQDRALRDMTLRWPAATYSRDDETAATLSVRIFGAGDGERVRLHLSGTNFQVKVWEALLAIPAGNLTTYGAIAERLGNPRAVRAVGTAVGRNPVSYLVPCHRVLQKSGALAGYHWGLRTKRAILALEVARADAREEAA